MGNPLGPTLANAFLCFHEKEWLKQCPNEFVQRTIKGMLMISLSYLKTSNKMRNLRHTSIIGIKI